MGRLFFRHHLVVTPSSALKQRVFCSTSDAWLGIGISAFPEFTQFYMSRMLFTTHIVSEFLIFLRYGFLSITFSGFIFATAKTISLLCYCATKHPVFVSGLFFRHPLVVTPSVTLGLVGLTSTAWLGIGISAFTELAGF